MNKLRSFLADQLDYWKEIYVFPPLSILFVVLAYWLIPLLTGGRHAVDDPGSIVGDCLTLAGLMIRAAAAGLIMSHIVGYKSEKLTAAQKADSPTLFFISALDSICSLFVLWLVLSYRLG